MLGWPATILQDGMDHFKHWNSLLSTVINSFSSLLIQFLCNSHFKHDKLCCQSSTNRLLYHKRGAKIAHPCFIPKCQHLWLQTPLGKGKRWEQGTFEMPSADAQGHDTISILPTSEVGESKVFLGLWHETDRYSLNF